MVIRIREDIKVSEGLPKWYDECAGNCFYAYYIDSCPGIYFAGIGLPILIEDCEILSNGEKKKEEYNLN